MRRRLWKALILLSIGFSLVWIVPRSGTFMTSKLSSDLPSEVESWVSRKLSVSAEEVKILAKDTTFSRAAYYDVKTRKPAVIVSVVFSGKDINNSLHRPEVCLRAQGWNFVSERDITLSDVLPDGNKFPMREIICTRPRLGSEQNTEGEVIVDKLIQYYTYIGSKAIVSGHYERTWEDVKSRVFKGADQQWAYLTVSMPVTQHLANQGVTILARESIDVDASRGQMNSLLNVLIPKLIED